MAGERASLPAREGCTVVSDTHGQRHAMHPATQPPAHPLLTFSCFPDGSTHYSHASVAEINGGVLVPEFCQSSAPVHIRPLVHLNHILVPACRCTCNVLASRHAAAWLRRQGNRQHARPPSLQLACNCACSSPLYEICWHAKDFQHVVGPERLLDQLHLAYSSGRRCD